MTPASNPTHYTDLIKELEAAPDRGLIARTLNKWKGFLRFQ
jgi:cytochrome b pre-mRNA-processing protein 6